MYQSPTSSPWGKVQTCDVLCPGVFMVSIASYGGTMVAKDMAAILSPAALKYGYQQNGFICYEEDKENIVFRELLDKKLWNIPARVRDKAAFEENINKSIRENNPDYWRARQEGLEKHLPDWKETRPATPNAEHRANLARCPILCRRRNLTIGLCKRT